MSFLTRPIARTARIAPTTSLRTLTTSRPLLEQELKRGPKMDSNTQDASKNSQSSASTDEHKSGADHPAKQPDQQAQPTRSTGIGGGEEVKGGKEGRDEISEAGKKNLAGQ
ncbi:hypothetical protein N0V91_001827 [Didymella pomorum]|uniref:Uncharacterized protein n=1 Tax=Didymella pomorum TaxID=749634 RepID=A0A9W9DC25_9PLEO|nr:hypothetical protein N0V91_001827 [Didymella pomorum]